MQYLGSDLKTLGIIVMLPIAASLIAYFAWKRVQNKRATLRHQTIASVIWRPGFRLTTESRRRFIDETAGARIATHTVFEYTLYAAVLITTALAVLFYRASLTDSQLASFNVHVGVVYFGLMAWVFSRLNTMYHKRKALGDGERNIHTELLQSQGEDRSWDVKRSRPLLGLTSIQFAILVVVFITALTAFTWALKIIK